MAREGGGFIQLFYISNIYRYIYFVTFAAAKTMGEESVKNNQMGRGVCQDGSVWQQI